jgi:hypothetical protein
MASNVIADMQMAIKRNAEDLRSELADLERWEDDVAAKEAARRKRAPVDADLPPIRGTPKPADAGGPKKPKEDPVQTAKDNGNDYFRQCKYEDAVRAYTKGINLDPDNSSMHVLYANRAMCYLKLQMWDLAEKDATTCVQMNRTYTKAFYRRALARKAMGKLKDARSDLETVLVLSPGDQDGDKELKAVTALLVEQATKAQASTATTAPKKKLVIQEVDDEDEEAPAAPKPAPKPAAAAAAAPSPVVDKEAKEREERHKRDHDAARQAENARAEARRRQAAEEEAKRQSARRSNARVELVDSDDEEFAKATAAPKPSAPKHADPAPPPRKVSTEVNKSALQAPKSFVEFESTYTDIMKKQPALLADYLALLPADKWKVVFGSSMTPEILADIFKAAMGMQPPVAVSVLTGVASVPRLSEVIMFMDDKDVKTGKSAVEVALKTAGDAEGRALRPLLSML